MERERNRPSIDSLSTPERKPRDPRIAELTKRLETGVEALMDSEGFKKYLKAAALLYQYSPNNIRLIVSQYPQATMANSYDRWQKLGRQVNAGEKGLKVFVPRLKKQLDPATGQEVETLVGWGLGNVFALEQTSGDPLPQPPAAKIIESSTNRGSQLFTYTKKMLARHDVIVQKKETMGVNGGGPLGYYQPLTREVYVDFRLPGDQQAKTLIHEAAHVLDKHGSAERSNLTRADEETIAEGTAFVVMNHYGIETGEYTFPYLAGWAKEPKTLLANLNHIQRTSRQLIDGIEDVAGKELAGD